MSKKMYVCRECNYAFPDELSHLIESNVQVYCERCGSPFILEGVVFKPAQTPYMRKKKPYQAISEKKSSNLEKLIQFLNKISFIPLFIFTFVAFGLISQIAIYWDAGILFEQISQGLMGLFLLIYDRAYISHKVKEKKYNEIFLDSFVFGILGCILYGLGVIILIKGIFIIIYVITDSKNKDLKKYDLGLLAKNSLNYFSAKAGFLIILFGIFRIYSDGIYIPRMSDWRIILPFNIEIPSILLFYFGFLLIALSVLIIDSRTKNEIKEKQQFKFKDSAKFFFLGIFGIIFYAAGIFILLKGVLLFFLFLGKPKEKSRIESTVTKPAYIAPTPPIQYNLKLHESLLPVKDEKDKKLVKEYFSKIFVLLSKDLRKQITDLKVSKKEKRELLEELAFLTKEEQVKYIDAIVRLYREIPKKLINRIRKLQNVKPKHYDKIVEQLKYMDVEEQIKFVQFLEENA